MVQGAHRQGDTDPVADGEQRRGGGGGGGGGEEGGGERRPGPGWVSPPARLALLAFMVWLTMHLAFGWWGGGMFPIITFTAWAWGGWGGPARRTARRSGGE